MAILVAVQGELALFRGGDVGVIIDTVDLNPYDPQPIETITASGGWTQFSNDLEAASSVPTVCFELADAALEGYQTDVSMTAAANDSRQVRVPKKVQDAVRAGLELGNLDENIEVPLFAAGVAERLLTGSVTLDTVKRMHSRLSSNPPSSVWTMYGGAEGAAWAAKTCGLTADASVPVDAPPLPTSDETEFADPNEPHEFISLDEDDPVCAICGLPEDDSIHVFDEAVPADYASDVVESTEDEAPAITYFAAFAPGGDTGPTFKVNQLLALDDTGAWWIREYGSWSPTQAPDANDDIVQLDDESYNAVLSQLDEPGASIAELSISEERLFELAKPQLDYDLLDAVFAAAPYVPPEVRSKNASKQLRDAHGQFVEAGGVVQDAAGDRGTIVSVDHEKGTVRVRLADGTVKEVPANVVTVDKNATPPANESAGSQPIAHLDGPATLIPDVKELIDNYLEQAQQPTGDEPGPTVAAGASDDPLIPPDEPAPTGATPTSSGPPLESAAAADDASDPVANSPVPPLYLAEVDPQDTAAVLAVLAVIPAQEEGANITVYKRDPGQWTLDNDSRQLIQGPTPPPLVQLDESQLQSVLDQVDQRQGDAPSDDATPEAVAAAAGGFAVLQKFAIDETGLTASQTQGARLLTSYNSPGTWPQDIKDRLNEFVAGREVTPNDVKNTERLREYWTHGEGGTVKIRWGEPNDWYRCVEHLSKYLGNRAKGYCTLRHHDALGVWPGQEDGGRGRRGVHASALVGEVQESLLADARVLDADQPHEFFGDSTVDAECGICERPLAHQLHLIVIGDDVYGVGNVEPTADDAPPPDVPGAEHISPDGEEPAMVEIVVVTHPFTPGPEDLCECGLEQDNEIHADDSGVEDTGETDVVPEDVEVAPVDEEDDGLASQEINWAGLHPFSFSTHEGVCACGRPQHDMLHGGDPRVLLADASSIDPGQRFRIPLVVPEGTSSGDGRTFAENSLTSRPMPLALMWQPEGDEGHNGAVIVGRIDHVERISNGLGNAYGVFDTGPWGQEALRLVRAGMLRGISADLDEFSANVVGGGEDPEHVTNTKLMVTSGRLMGITLVAKPAFAECTIELIDGEGDSEVPDGEYSQTDGEARLAALIAAAAPLQPPAEWFENPNLTKATHLTIDDDGRVYGHIAAWDMDHIGLPYGTRAPRSLSNYAYFRTGVIRTADGTDVPVGQLTLTGGHAPLRHSAALAVKHYDDTASAVADLAAGEDKFGIWVAGALRPGVTPEQVRALRASSPSGDWRPIKGSLELVAVCQVNVPGFPVARTLVAGGQVMALVAAGCIAPETDDLKTAPQEDIDARLARLEAAEQRRLDAQAFALKERMSEPLEVRRSAMTAAALDARRRVDAVRREKQEALLAAAETARQRVHPERKILLEKKNELKSRVAAGGLHVAPQFEENKHPRDDKGRFREVLARLESLLHGDSHAQDAAQSGIQKVEDAAQKEAAGDHGAAVKAAHDGAAALEDAAKSATGEAKQKLGAAATAVKQAASEHDDEAGITSNEKVHYDALPAPIKELLDEAVTRAEQQLDPANPEELWEKIKAFITGTNPLSVHDVYRFIKNQLKREVTPHPVRDTAPNPGPSTP